MTGGGGFGLVSAPALVPPPQHTQPRAGAEGCCGDQCGHGEGAEERVLTPGRAGAAVNGHVARHDMHSMPTTRQRQAGPPACDSPAAVALPVPLAAAAAVALALTPPLAVIAPPLAVFALPAGVGRPSRPGLWHKGAWGSARCRQQRWRSSMRAPANSSTTYVLIQPRGERCWWVDWGSRGGRTLLEGRLS